MTANDSQGQYYELIKRYIAMTCDRLGLTRDDLSLLLGGSSRTTLQAAQNRASGIGLNKLIRFVEKAELSDAQAAELVAEWCWARMDMTTHAAEFSELRNRLRAKSSPAEWADLERTVFERRKAGLNPDS